MLAPGASQDPRPGCGTAFLAAAVSGNGKVAQAGLLSVVVSGPRAAFEAVEHLDFTPTFTPVLLQKDSDLGLAAARELEVPMPVSAAAREQVQSAVARGRTDEDFAVLLELQAANSGLVLKPESEPVDDGLG